MNRFRLILLAAFLAVIAGTILAYWLNPPAKLPVMEDPGQAQLEGDGKPRVRGLTYTHVQDGVRKWSLAARGAKYDEDTGIVTLFKPEVVFFQEKGGEITIRGKVGQYDQKNQVVHLKEEVLARTKDGKYMETDQITYSEVEQVADTNSWVTVAGPGFKVVGKGMLVVVPQSKVTFKSQVDSTFIPQGTGPPPGATMDEPADSPAGGKP
ncbi:MAG: LPS export ABC transporter periplasmic protein LptC [Desulfarculus sp.]|nr:LPS export ABC transporter periplasmic protein LptC [Desulfarculus sp.]